MTEPTVDPAELSAAATARLAQLRDGGPGRAAMFTSDLSVNEFLLVREAGFRPLGLVLGSSIYHVGVQTKSWTKSQELQTLSQAMYHARELAMSRMTAEADALGADGIVGVRLDIEFTHAGSNLAEFIAVGTAVAGDEPPPQGRWRNNLDQPFTSDLSGQDFWTLLQAGYAPLGLVMGSCVYHLARRSAVAAVRTFAANAEIEPFTQALYDARETAMARMQAEGEALDAEGIVGVELSSFAHAWGEHTTEFFAIGTAVRALRDEHTVPTPTMVVSLSDPPSPPPRSG